MKPDGRLNRAARFLCLVPDPCECRLAVIAAVTVILILVVRLRTSCVSLIPGNRRFLEITGKDNLTVFSYSGRVKSPEWKRQLRRADLRQF